MDLLAKFHADKLPCGDLRWVLELFVDREPLEGVNCLFCIGDWLAVQALLDCFLCNADGNTLGELGNLGDWRKNCSSRLCGVDDSAKRVSCQGNHLVREQASL